MKRLLVLLFLFPGFSYAQQYCKHRKSKVCSYQNPVYSEEAGMFPIGQTLSKNEIQLENNAIVGSGFNTTQDFIWSDNFLARYGLFKLMEIQSGIYFQGGFDTHSLYDYNKRYQFVIKQSVGEWFKTRKGGVPSSICLKYIYQELDSVYSTNHHLFGLSINHTFYNLKWRISFALAQYYPGRELIQTISIKAVRKTNNPQISFFAGYRDNLNAYNIMQLGIICSDLKKNRFDISIGRIMPDIFTVNLSYSYRL